LDKKYRVVFLGLKVNKENFRQNMTGLGVRPSTIEQMIKKAPIVIKGEMRLGDARKYADAIQDAGGKVQIQEHGLFENTRSNNKSLEITPLGQFTMCPECGHKQLKENTCEKCGFVFKKKNNG